MMMAGNPGKNLTIFCKATQVAGFQDFHDYFSGDAVKNWCCCCLSPIMQVETWRQPATFLVFCQGNDTL